MRSHAQATVLAVEDDPIVRADLRLVLEDAGFEVCGDARDGVEAVELARALSPDVILLDLGLPGLDGVGATRQILAERDVPIVALTGRSRALIDEALEAGVSSYVLKPFEREEVVGALLDALATHPAAEPRASEHDSVPAAVTVPPESLHTLAQLAIAFGSQGRWAEELDRQAWQASRAWRRVQ